MNIIFAFTVFYFLSDLQFKYELSEQIQLNEQNLIVRANTFIIIPKIEHVILHSVGTNHKNFGWKKKKMEIYFVECPRHSAKYALPSVASIDTRQSTFFVEYQRLALGKDNGRKI
jgi:hypothetical protein